MTGVTTFPGVARKLGVASLLILLLILQIFNMAASYPTSLKSFTTIDCNTNMNTSGKTGPDIVTELQEEVAAMQTKIGVDSSAVNTSHDYKLSGVATGDKAMSLTGSETGTNKTFTNVILNGTVSGTGVLDEDDMASDSATKVPTQQSVKAYVDAEVAAATPDTWVPVNVATYVPTLGSYLNAVPMSDLRISGDVESLINAGARIKYTQNSIEKYGVIVTNYGYDGSTETRYLLMERYGVSSSLRLQDTTTYPITSFEYSYGYAPQDFPLQPSDYSDWNIELTITTASGTSGGTLEQLTFPEGLWDMYGVFSAGGTASGAQEAALIVELTNNTSSTISFIDGPGSSYYMRNTVYATNPKIMHYPKALVNVTTNSATAGAVLNMKVTYSNSNQTGVNIGTSTTAQYISLRSPYL